MVKCCCRFDIEDLFKQAESAFKTLSIFAPKEKAEELGSHIKTLNERLEVAQFILQLSDSGRPSRFGMDEFLQSV